MSEPGPVWLIPSPGEKLRRRFHNGAREAAAIELIPVLEARLVAAEADAERLARSARDYLGIGTECVCESHRATAEALAAHEARTQSRRGEVKEAKV